MCLIISESKNSFNFFLNHFLHVDCHAWFSMFYFSAEVEQHTYIFLFLYLTANIWRLFNSVKNPTKKTKQKNQLMEIYLV